MNWHRNDFNMRAADEYYAAVWTPEDFDACCKCGCDFADSDDDDHDPHAVQSKEHPALCQFCADTLGDDE
ncbi:hypothetical protein ACHFJ0_04840 [Paracoccus sp. NGMCC 1.201697]|uniref:Uncharacterized protein n=1 Tax=Paracoccus broussonetiae subsp. drimophilus TaxID=3373869 RepID=A0ABW7LHF9_9RHOB